MDNDDATWQQRQDALGWCVTGSTFDKIEAIRLKMPADQQENIDNILVCIAQGAEASDNIWIQRYKFENLKQQEGESFQQFEQKILEIMSKCKFDEGFSDDDKPKVRDLILLYKFVFHTRSDEARREIFKVPQADLDVEKARTIIVMVENIRKTEVLTMSGETVVQLSKPKFKPKNLPKKSTESNLTYCSRCGSKTHTGESDKCPAKKSMCRKCSKNWSLVS
jgi:hypothetical protein